MRWECHVCGQPHEELPDRCTRCGAVPEVVLNLWKCAHCGKGEIPGTSTVCPDCGAAKGTGIEARVDTGRRVEGERGLALARGKWLYCSYCDVQVPPVSAAGRPNETCPNCGGPLGEAEKEVASQTLSAAEAGAYRKESAQKLGAAHPAPATKPAPPKKSRRTLVIVALVLLGLFVGIYLLFFHGWKKDLVVSERSWRRAIEVEAFGPVSEEAWLNEMPSGAYDRSCSRKVHHHDKVPDGIETYTDREAAGRECASYEYKTQGGVSVKQCAHWETKYRTVTKTRTRYRQVPVYREHCRFRVDKWHRSRELVAAGHGNEAPAWPSIEALAQAKERAGKRSESYQLLLAMPNAKTVSYECPTEAEWARYPLKARVVAEMTTSGRVRKLLAPK